MKISIIYKEENGWYVGHIQEYPEFESQGENLDELKENLLDIYEQKGTLPLFFHQIKQEIWEVSL
ncbi:hypothetical protein [uncultured Candidatus Kuenenia sp.]|jgi:predicted RNase H-like HicB family nuclease|uniref:type II toxin-antitoxin system HicB family antitoxin n=1 Tax=Candidatus Kuenenia sp. TaxID=2499824 RepID=UPI001D917063|nr:hypothetical protein [uncultured Candidatus Kuenenia sp.]MBE7547877.1 type II toxin-antitoxin system HicB family antitoxin [Planctomycetia bacterium]